MHGDKARQAFEEGMRAFCTGAGADVPKEYTEHRISFEMGWRWAKDCAPYYT